MSGIVLRAADLVDRDGFDRGRLFVPIVQQWINQGWVGQQYPAAARGDFEEDYVLFEDAPVGDYLSGGLALWPALARWVFPRVSPEVLERVQQFQPGTGEYGNFIFVATLVPDPAVPGRKYFDVPALSDIPAVVTELTSLADIEVSDAEVLTFLDEIFPRRSDAWVLAHYEFADQMWLSDDESLCPAEWRQRYGVSGPARYWTDRAAEVLDDAGLRRLAQLALDHKRESAQQDPEMTRDWFTVNVVEALIDAARSPVAD